VAKEYAHKEGIDYEENVSPTLKWTVIHALLSLAAMNRWNIHHMEVNKSFLNGYLKENVYMSQLEGFSIKVVCKLINSLYGLKQPPRTWCEKLIEFILKINFRYYKINGVTLFVNKFGKIVVYLVVYVDDILIT
jgi:hypothetical protein